MDWINSASSQPVDAPLYEYSSYKPTFYEVIHADLRG